MRLLLVEDEAAIRSALVRGLAQGGNEVHAAASLMEARAIAAQAFPEALLSDFKLPDGTGLDLAGELGVPFVMMSGYAAFDDAVQAMRMGCVDFFTKPVSIKDLRRALDRLQARARADLLQVVASVGERVRVARPAALGLVVQELSARTWTWSSAAEAHAVHEQAATICVGEDDRQALAELLQAAPAGRLTVNHDDEGWSAWLEAAVDWQGAQAERRALIESLTERCVWRGDGALVECHA